VTLSKRCARRALQLPAWNEALSLPRPWDQQWSLRASRSWRYETDLLEYDDLFDGNPVVARKTAALVDGARAEVRGCVEAGGITGAIESGHMKAALVRSMSAASRVSSRRADGDRGQPPRRGAAVAADHRRRRRPAQALDPAAAEAARAPLAAPEPGATPARWPRRWRR
jgi:hypothetical protein